MRCIVVDDEQLAREGIADYITQLDFLKLSGLCKDAIEAENLLSKTQVDLMFLDVQMPKMSGLDFLRTTTHPPLVVITTAYPNYALEGFELNVLDYLVKPITFKRFLQSAHKAKNQFQLLQTNASAKSDQDDFFFVKCEQKFEKILIDDILFVEAMQNYVRIKCKKRSYVSLISLKVVKAELHASRKEVFETVFQNKLLKK